MKKIIFAALAFFSFLASQAQFFEPVKWKTHTEKGTGNEVTLVFDAEIESGWHVYSQFTPDGGPLPIEITYKAQAGNYALAGKTSESKTQRHFNDVFGVDEVYFENKLQLRQKIKVLKASLNKVEVMLSYQVCADKCINDEKKFSFDIPALTIAPGAAATTDATVAATTEVPVDTITETKTATAEVKQATPASEAPKPAKKEKSLWVIFLGTIVAGLLATITPCVFPMIPMTVSFFIKRTSNKAKGKFEAFFYGFCIIFIYVLISLPFHIFEKLSPNIFTDISTNVPLNLFFFAIFIVFAVSFFGAFEITIPSRFANKADNASNSGGLIGIFFMALTLIIVSFSCTGPALGFVLGSVLSTDGGAMILTVAMFGFGLGLGLPFMLLALFPRLMTNLPKSGGWLNTVKVVFGFIELALAFKFLSNADLVLDAHILEREIFLAFWIAIFAALTLYLFGKVKLPHDDNQTSISVGRMILGLLTLTFTIYMIPGLWGAPVKVISAFVPPQSYSESPEGLRGGGTTAAEALPPGAVYGPNHIVAFEDYEEGLAYAKKVNKPVMLDFTGKACQNCRLTETNVWSDPRILKLLQNDVVLVSLYCDLRKELPANEKKISEETGSEINTIGQKWSEFERKRYQSNARPFYVLMAHDESSLNDPIGYTPDVEEYYSWLKGGIEKFRK